jgi:hypothetical protein
MCYIKQESCGRIGVGPFFKALAWWVVVGSKPLDPKTFFKLATCLMTGCHVVAHAWATWPRGPTTFVQKLTSVTLQLVHACIILRLHLSSLPSATSTSLNIFVDVSIDFLQVVPLFFFSCLRI